jgi:hypothetical protein
MIGQMTGHMNPGTKNPHGTTREEWSDSGRRRAQIMDHINSLYIVSRRGLWRLLLFLACSTAALGFRNVDLFASLSENIREMLGAPPPLILVHCVLAVSTLSAIILIAGNGAEEISERHRWSRLGLSVCFYPLYAVTHTLETFFPMVLAAGLIILVFEHVTIYFQTSKEIREEKLRLGNIS